MVNKSTPGVTSNSSGSADSSLTQGKATESTQIDEQNSVFLDGSTSTFRSTKLGSTMSRSGDSKSSNQGDSKLNISEGSVSNTLRTVTGTTSFSNKRTDGKFSDTSYSNSTDTVTSGVSVFTAAEGEHHTESGKFTSENTQDVTTTVTENSGGGVTTKNTNHNQSTDKVTAGTYSNTSGFDATSGQVDCPLDCPGRR